MAEAPVPVQLALEALKILAAEDTALAEESRKKLPGFALRLAQSGEEVTMEKLLAAARAREIDRVPVPQQKQKTYAEIVAAFPGGADSEVRAEQGPDAYLFRAARAGNFNGLMRVVSNYVDYSHSVRARRLMERVLRDGSLEMIKTVNEKYKIDYTGLEYAAETGRLDAVQYIIKECGDKISDRLPHYINMLLKKAAAACQLGIVKYLVEECGADVNADYGRPLTNAALKDRGMDIVKYLVEERGAQIYSMYESENAFCYAAFGAQTEALEYLLEKGGVPSKEIVAKALDNTMAFFGARPSLRRGWNSIEVINCLVEKCGVNPFVLHDDIRKKLEKYRSFCTVWQKAAHINPPVALMEKDAAFFKPVAYNAVCDMLRLERDDASEDINYGAALPPPSEDTNRLMAFHAAGLFGTEDRVLQYLEKWGSAGKQPLHDLIYKIKLPEKKTSEMDLKAWGDAVLKCGPSMARLVKFADKMPMPEKSDDGKTWSMRKTREVIAQFIYARAKENPELATLCFENNVTEKSFDKALEISKKVPAVKNIPDITIDGEKFGLSGATFHRLAANDVRGLFLGELTDCCQSIGGAGAKCAEHGFTSENGGFYVIENAKGRVIGQTWAWRGEEGELVFDSLETLGKNVTGEQWVKLTLAAEDAIRENARDVTAFHIGKGGATPRLLSTAFSKAASPAKPLAYDGYRDSHSQLVVWKRKGGMKNG